MENSSNSMTDKSIQKKISTDDVKERLRKAMTCYDPEHVLQSVGGIISKNVKGSEELSKDENEILERAMLLVGHERHYLVAESVVDERWRPMVMDLAKCIQKEYACVANSEIALAGLAASAYYRSLKAARRMSALLEKTEIGMVGVNLLNHVGKEIDRAERQYLNAIEMLRNRRQPQLNVKVQTKTAFFGNQTINAQRSVEPYENNDPQ